MDKILVVASNNKNKIREIKQILGDMFDPVSLSEAGVVSDPEETGKTFLENAIIKARAAAEVSGKPAIADDSGLSVDALGGAPGIYSARYAGDHGNDEENNQLLLKNMEGVEDRTCRFVCAMALALPGEKTRVVRGEAVGQLLTEYAGQGGFGYDPLFLYETGETFAQMSEKEKNAVSHRFHAVALLRKELEQVF